MPDNGRADLVAAEDRPVPLRRSLTRRPNPRSRRSRERLSPQATLREVMGQFATGVTVLTAGNGANCHGMTANAFTSVSLDPPMVLCCIAKAARMHETITTAQSFAVSILGAQQQDVAKHFADWKRPKGMAQFEAVDWERGHRTGTPLLSGALAWLECELVKAHDGGDHSIFVGHVLSALCNTDVEPQAPAAANALLFYSGGFHEMAQAA